MKIRWITQTAVFVALLVVVQFLTSGLGNTYVTGSAVNLILIVSVMTCGLPSGLTVAMLSPILARMFGIGPAFWIIVPFIMMGNAVLVTVWHFVANNKTLNTYAARIAALIAGAVLKFGALYVGVVLVAVPVILQLPQPQAGVVSAAFSFPQLITASIGGIIAIIILPVLEKALKKN